jgi:hypothetical protein
VALTNQAATSSGYTMTGSNYTPSNFYSYDNYYGGGSFSGSFYDIWDGYFGDYCSFDDAYDACGGNIWSGLNSSSGSIWNGYSSSSGIWDGYNGGSYGPSAASTPPLAVFGRA